MPVLEVHKFGGTSVGNASAFRQAATLVARAHASDRQVVVACSAMSGVTDALIAVVQSARGGRADTARDSLQGLRTRHHQTLAGLGVSRPVEESLRQTLDSLFDELYDLVAACTVLGELTPRTRDRIVATGEKLAVPLLAAAVLELGVPAVPVCADTFLATDSSHGSASPLGEACRAAVVATLGPMLAAGQVPIVTGFCGRSPAGATTTLGRGATDFTATILAGALGAAAVTIWTDVAGVFSTDPRVVPEARPLVQLHYREAAELSFYGAKVLHQRTMIPVSAAGIPVTIRSTFDPDAAGTVVDGRSTAGSHPVKALSAVRDHALLSVEGKGMAGVPGIAARVFGALAAESISVTMISQSSSESSICLAVPQAQAAVARESIQEALQRELQRGDVEAVLVQPNVGLVAAVGLGMAHIPGISGRLFSALGAARINVLAIAQGSSELNVTVAVLGSDVDGALRTIHREFGLDRIDSGVETERYLDLLLLGCGSIGRAFVAQVLERRAHVFERFGLHPRVVAIADRSGFLIEPKGLELERLRGILDAKAEGGRLAELEGGSPGTPEDMVQAVLAYRLSRPVLVDVSDSDTAHLAWLAALQRRCDVATANKKPLAGDLSIYEALTSSARKHRRILRCEATVGAGLPVVDTLEMLLHTGDRLTSATGSLSGTLGFLMTRLEEGVPLSAAVEEAVSLGYTEPDPVDDLSGEDVARKATILGRLSGLAGEGASVALEGLVDPGWAGLPVSELLQRLRDHVDGPMAVRVAQARAQGSALRFVAKVEQDRIVVGPAVVPADSALGMLRGTDNQVVFHSERYQARPLVITGPGAGVEVTAMGVLGDVLRIAAERGGTRGNP
jgi:aspartokinase/homoserine dehydrogenase 1